MKGKQISADLVQILRLPAEVFGNIDHEMSPVITMPAKLIVPTT